MYESRNKKGSEDFFFFFFLHKWSFPGMVWELEEMSKEKENKMYYNKSIESLQNSFWYYSHVQIMKSLMSHELKGCHTGLKGLSIMV